MLDIAENSRFVLIIKAALSRDTRLPCRTAGIDSRSRGSIKGAEATLTVATLTTTSDWYACAAARQVSGTRWRRCLYLARWRVCKCWGDICTAELAGEAAQNWTPPGRLKDEMDDPALHIAAHSPVIAAICARSAMPTAEDPVASPGAVDKIQYLNRFLGFAIFVRDVPPVVRSR